MPNSNEHFTCQHPGCDKPATRALTYFIDPPPPETPSLDAKQDAFCDEHAEMEMIQLQTSGFFTVVRRGAELNCTVNDLTNCQIADDGSGMKADSIPAFKSVDTRLGLSKKIEVGESQ